ncbi:MAG: hypothetical protein NUW08_03655, partial [Candidatus Uhrbacteria bacterium]|nr:hypothetical protein [Candidatus Uhrbacteria bacterium]
REARGHQDHGADNQQNVAKSRIHSDWLRLTELSGIDKPIDLWNVVYHMNMKTSPNDLSNQALLNEIRSAIEDSKGEVLETVQSLAQHMDERFDVVDRRVTRVETLMVTKDELQNEMSKLKTTMVTKGYLDDKLADHHSEIILHTQREIEKAVG